MFRKNLCDSKCSLKITSFSDNMIRGLFKTIETHNLTTAGNAKIASNRFFISSMTAKRQRKIFNPFIGEYLLMLYIGIDRNS